MDICCMFKSKPGPPSAKTKGRLPASQTIWSPHDVDIVRHGDVFGSFRGLFVSLSVCFSCQMMIRLCCFVI